MKKIRTRWFDKVDRECPLPEYPRPQLVRENWINLNGTYQYCVTDRTVDYPRSFDGEITVPFSIETELSGVCRPFLPLQRLWYKRSFTLDDSFKNKLCILHFGAVDWKCVVYVNGRLAGRHTGGYMPFSFDITDYIKDGENILVVGVSDPTDMGWQQRGKQRLKPHGFWYTATSGIWQTVWLEPVSDTHITKIRLTPDIDSSKISIITSLSGCTDKAVIKAQISDGENEIFFGEISQNDFVIIPEQKLWSPESPFLYDLVLNVYVDGVLCDTVKSYFGMRKFHIGRDDKGIPRLFLNNEPYFQRGLLDQGYYCEGGLTPPTDEAMIFDIRTMKELGFNMLRKHIKVEPARWYYHCDRLGMLVWQDMISGGAWIGNLRAGVLPTLGIRVSDDNYNAFSRGKSEWRENFKHELFEMLDTLYNAVSIYCWVPFNEGWGQFDAKKIADEVKSFDPGRIVDHASGWYDQGGRDLKSMHKYILPVPKIKPDGRPFVISEFGGYSHVIDGHVFDNEKSFGYRMFKDGGTLTCAYRKLMEKQIIPLIDRYLCAFVYTQVTDVELEVNGILTYDREIMKIDAETIKELNNKMNYSEVKKGE